MKDFSKLATAEEMRGLARFHTAKRFRLVGVGRRTIGYGMDFIGDEVALTIQPGTFDPWVGCVNYRAPDGYERHEIFSGPAAKCLVRVQQFLDFWLPTAGTKGVK